MRVGRPIGVVRADINDVDVRLGRLLAERSKLVAEAQTAKGKVIRDETRERVVLDTVAAAHRRAGGRYKRETIGQVIRVLLDRFEEVVP